MRRRLILAGVVAAVCVVALAAAFFGPRLVLRARAERAIVAYDHALATAIREQNPDALSGVAEQREISRVSSYITLLWGTGVTVDSSLVGIDVGEVTSEEPTVTAVAVETWRYQRRDSGTGETLEDEVTETQTLQYTLVPDDSGTLRVYLSRLLEGTGER